MRKAMVRTMVGAASCAVAVGPKREADCNWSWFDWKALPPVPNSLYIWGTARGVAQETLLIPTKVVKSRNESTFESVALGPSCIVATTNTGEVLLWRDAQTQPVVLYQVRKLFYKESKYAECSCSFNAFPQSSGGGTPIHVACTQNLVVCVTKSGELLRWESPSSNRCSI